MKWRYNCMLLHMVIHLIIVSSILAEPLHDAVQKGDSNQVQRLIAQDADVNAKTPRGLTPLHIAAAGGELVVSEQLIANGAQVNAKDAKGRTPLHESARGGHTTQVEWLIRQGADVNAKDERGITPLYLAVIGGYPDVVKQLIANGADVSTAAQLIDNLGVQAEDSSTPQSTVPAEEPRATDIRQRDVASSLSQPAAAMEALPRSPEDRKQPSETTPTTLSAAVPETPPPTATALEHAVIHPRLQWETNSVSYQYPAQASFTIRLPKLTSMPENLPTTVILDASDQAPSWLQFDPDTLQLHGTAPMTAVNLSFHLTFRAQAEGTTASSLDLDLTIAKPGTRPVIPRQNVSESEAPQRFLDDDCLVKTLKGITCENGR